MHHASPDEHEHDDLDHEPSREIGEQGHGHAWALNAGEVAESVGSSSTPHVSLFSPGMPTILSEESDNLATESTRVHVGSSSSSNSSRPLATLASVANMTKRTSRMKVSDEQTPIVQLHTKIPPAQKDADDPTTPVDHKRSKDTRGREYTTLTTLSRLFAGESTMPNSRTPSYNQAAGPLYLRGSPHACVASRLHANFAQLQMNPFPFPTTSTLAASSRDGTQI